MIPDLKKGRCYRSKSAEDKQIGFSKMKYNCISLNQTRLVQYSGSPHLFRTYANSLSAPD